MSRSLWPSSTAARIAAVLVLALWWLPTLAIRLAAIPAGYVRVLSIVWLAHVLATFGRRDAARAVLVAELRRCERRMDTIGLQRRGRAP